MASVKHTHVVSNGFGGMRLSAAIHSELCASSHRGVRRWAQCLSESSFLLTMLLHKSRRELLSAVFRHASAAGDEVAAVQDTDVLMEEIGQGLGGI